MHVVSLKRQAGADEKLASASFFSATESARLLSVMLSLFAWPCCRPLQGCLVFASSLDTS